MPGTVVIVTVKSGVKNGSICSTICNASSVFFARTYKPKFMLYGTGANCVLKTVLSDASCSLYCFNLPSFLSASYVRPVISNAILGKVIATLELLLSMISPAWSNLAINFCLGP